MLHLLRTLVPRPLMRVYHYCLARVADIWYGRPSRKLFVIGITGTSGKSTTVYLLSRILDAVGILHGVTSTLFFKVGKREWLNDKKMTMLGRFQTQKLLADMVKAGCTHAIVETTSQGIEQFRHIGIKYDIAVLTNLHPEHLEAHGGFANYKKAKRKLFYRGASVHIINGDDPYAAEFLSAPAAKKIAFHIPTESPFALKLLGSHNKENAICAATIAEAIGVAPEQVAAALQSVESVPGRLEFVEREPFAVIVDYAFEPVAMNKLYEAVNALPHKRIIHVLGSTGGGRDKARRAQLGAIVAANAAIVIATNEDPYDEDPAAIIAEVSRGAAEHGKINGTNLFAILDRREAIRRALALALPGDIVLVTGKGSEQAMAVADGRLLPWDDREVIREELHGLTR